MSDAVQYICFAWMFEDLLLFLFEHAWHANRQILICQFLFFFFNFRIVVKHLSVCYVLKVLHLFFSFLAVVGELCGLCLV